MCGSTCSEDETSGSFATFVIFSTKLNTIDWRETILKHCKEQRCFLCGKNSIVFAHSGCSFGGRGDQKIPTHQELPELLAHPWLFHFWGADPTPHCISACGYQNLISFLSFLCIRRKLWGMSLSVWQPGSPWSSWAWRGMFAHWDSV